MGHQLASWAIDNEKPGEQKKLADIDPDLYGKMNEGPKDMAAFCMYLDQLLRKGEITNEEERLFVTSLLDPLVEIPVYPLWDPDGNVIGQTTWNAIHAAATVRRTSKKFGMFTQSLVWGADETLPDPQTKGNTPQQRALKTMIMIHLLPELRHADNGDKVTLTNTLNGFSVVPKNVSAAAFMQEYLTTGYTKTDMGENNNTFNKITQSPASYGLSLYGNPQAQTAFFGAQRAVLNFLFL